MCLTNIIKYEQLLQNKLAILLNTKNLFPANHTWHMAHNPHMASRRTNHANGLKVLVSVLRSWNSNSKFATIITTDPQLSVGQCLFESNTCYILKFVFIYIIILAPSFGAVRRKKLIFYIIHFNEIELRRTHANMQNFSFQIHSKSNYTL